MRHLAVPLLLLLAACGGNNAAPVPAQAHAAASSAVTVGGATLQATTVALDDLNDAVAARYGIERDGEGVLLLVTVRDAAGNAIDPGDLQLTATASVLPEPARPLALRAIQSDGMTDYLGVVRAGPPASVRFALNAVRGGSRAELTTTADLQPR